MGSHCARLQGGVGLGLYRKGMVLSSSLETVGFDTLPQTGNTADKGLFWASWITSWKVYCSPGKEDMWGEPGDRSIRLWSSLLLMVAALVLSGKVWPSLLVRTAPKKSEGTSRP